jgi:hypothetical protein
MSLPDILSCRNCGDEPTKQITYIGGANVHYECCEIRTKVYPNNKAAIEAWNRWQQLMQRTVYYAHSIAIYDTPQEVRDERLLKALGFDVLTPNAPGIEEQYREKGMEFFRTLIEQCDALAFRAHPDTNVSAGVSKEISFARVMNKPVFEIPTDVKRRTLSVELTRQYLRETGVR